MQTCVFLQRIGDYLRILKAGSGIQAVNHHQAALGRREFFHFLPNQGVNLPGRSAKGDLLAVDIQLNAHLPLEVLSDPIDSIDQILQVQNLAAALNDVVCGYGYRRRNAYERSYRHHGPASSYADNLA